jgi:hypothetical protein
MLQWLQTSAVLLLHLLLLSVVVLQRARWLQQTQLTFPRLQHQCCTLPSIENTAPAACETLQTSNQGHCNIINSSAAALE